MAQPENDRNPASLSTPMCHAAQCDQSANEKYGVLTPQIAYTHRPSTAHTYALSRGTRTRVLHSRMARLCSGVWVSGRGARSRTRSSVRARAVAASVLPLPLQSQTRRMQKAAQRIRTRGAWRRATPSHTRLGAPSQSQLMVRPSGKPRSHSRRRSRWSRTPT